MNDVTEPHYVRRGNAIAMRTAVGVTLGSSALCGLQDADIDDAIAALQALRDSTKR